MKKKLCISSFLIIFILFMSSVPAFESQSIKNDLTKKTNDIIYTNKPDLVEMRIYRCRGNGTIEETIKKMSYDEKEEMMRRLIQTDILNLTLNEVFEEKLEILKEYDLVSNDIVLKDIINLSVKMML